MEEFCELLHELDTHRIELELQNDELLNTQKHLQDTTQDYVDFYHFSPVGYVTLDSEGIILKANMTLATLFGMEKQDVINKPFSDFVLDTDQDIFYLYRQEVLACEHSKSCELRLRGKSGHVVWVKLDGPFKTAQKGRVMSLALTEINRLKEIEALLIKSESSLRAIFDNVLDGIIRINEHGIIESINAATESLFGYSREALLGRPISQLLPKLDWCAYKNKSKTSGRAGGLNM
jgi:two-component system CheB/CheR fusion protein